MSEIFYIISSYSEFVGKTFALFGLVYYMCAFYAAFSERLSLFDVGVFKWFNEPEEATRLVVIGNNLLLLFLTTLIPFFVGYLIPFIVACGVAIIFWVVTVICNNLINMLFIFAGLSIFTLSCFVARAGKDEQKRVVKEIIESVKAQSLNK
jgi:hypothetical protein